MTREDWPARPGAATPDLGWALHAVGSRPTCSVGAARLSARCCSAGLLPAGVLADRSLSPRPPRARRGARATQAKVLRTRTGVGAQRRPLVWRRCAGVQHPLVPAAATTNDDE